jgi:hypothetical protein
MHIPVVTWTVELPYGYLYESDAEADSAKHGCDVAQVGDHLGQATVVVQAL